MKNFLTLTVLSFILLSCSSGPGDVAKKFSENFSHGKVEEAKKYATEPTGRLLDMANSFGAITVDPDYRFKKVKDSVVGNRAWVTFIDPDGEEDVFELVKIDGKWLVQMEPQK